MNAMKLTLFLLEVNYSLAVDMLGYWTPSNLKAIKIITSKTTSCNTTSLSRAINNLMQLSVMLCVFNARLIHGCLQLRITLLQWLLFRLTYVLCMCMRVSSGSVEIY